MRRKQNIQPNDISLLASTEDKIEALRIILVTKNLDQFKDLKSVLDVGDDCLIWKTLFYQCCRSAETDYLETFFKMIVEAEHVKKRVDFSEFYVFLAKRITLSSKVNIYRNNLLALLKQCMSQSLSLRCDMIGFDVLNLMAASICWKDRDIFDSCLNSLHQIQPVLLQELLRPINSQLRHLVDMLNTNFIHQRQIEELFDEFSITSENARKMQFSFDEISAACMSLVNPFETLQLESEQHRKQVETCLEIALGNIFRISTRN